MEIGLEKKDVGEEIFASETSVLHKVCKEKVALLLTTLVIDATQVRLNFITSIAGLCFDEIQELIGISGAPP